MIAIQGEIDRVGAGEWPADDNPLAQRAAHRASDSPATWAHPYSARARRVPGRRRPGARSTGRRCGRIDGAYGDRNLVCACPPVAEYA